MAVFLVISVHFFLYNGFYKQPQSDSGMILHTSFRYFTYACVPLFCLISGYLLNKKTLSLGYYKGIIKILYVYLLSSAVDAAFSAYYLHEDIDFIYFLKSLFHYSAAPYAWYINMYIGLFLMIPFLNVTYNNLASKRHKLVLVATFTFVICVPSFVNGLAHFLPNYWKSFYPIAYYFIGAYISEFKPKPNKLLLLAGIVLDSLFEGVVANYQSGSNPLDSTLDGFYNFPTAVMAVLIFLLFYDINIKNKVAANIFKATSNAALGIYLTSYIFDNIFYPKLNAAVEAVGERYKYYFLIVPLIFICSFIVSALINLSYKAVLSVTDKVKSIIVSKIGPQNAE